MAAAMTVSDEQVRFVATRAAQVLLENAAHPDRLDKLREYASWWFPDADSLTLREVAGKLQLSMEHFATLLEGRLNKMVAAGKAVEVVGRGA
jgi:hypothetical protein